MNGAKPPPVLITGAGGYIGRLTIKALAELDQLPEKIIAADIYIPDASEQLDGVEYLKLDVRDQGLSRVLAENSVGSVIHLASIVTPGKKSNRELEYSVDVLGTRNVIDCCLEAGTAQLIVTSSGAAYGYYPDNSPRLDEHDDPIRGNPEFAYSDHKRRIEEMLALAREEHPELAQLIFRPGTILGQGTRNQITDLFDRRLILGLRGAATPFVFIWDQDVVTCLVKGYLENSSGIFNLAGDGTLTMARIAELLGKTYLNLPVGLIAGALAILKKLGLTQYGPEQVNFLRYRPVLANRRLKEEFGYTPKMTTEEVFKLFLRSRQNGG